MKIQIENTIGLVIDIQSKLIPHIAESESLISNNIRLIKGLRLLGVPLVVTEQYPKGLGTTDSLIAESLEDDYRPLIKDTFSCFGSDEISNNIKKHKPTNIIIVGIEAHICVMQTVVDSLRAGYSPIVVADCVSSRNLYDKKIGLKRMVQEKAMLATYESILMELTVGSFNPKFKEVSKIIK